MNKNCYQFIHLHITIAYNEDYISKHYIPPDYTFIVKNNTV